VEEVAVDHRVLGGRVLRLAGRHGARQEGERSRRGDERQHDQPRADEPPEPSHPSTFFAAAIRSAASAAVNVPQLFVEGAGPEGLSTGTACRYRPQSLPLRTANLTSA